MPSINPDLVPTLVAGTIFSEFTDAQGNYNVRWLTATDPVFYAAYNRVYADIVLRQLIIAKAVDGISVNLGHQTLYPFLIPPLVGASTEALGLPTGWIWDIHVSMPSKWTQLRLAKIKRISGTNGATSSITGKLRLIFTAVQDANTTERSIFYADYHIDSALSFQVSRITVATTVEEANAVDAADTDTINGFIQFRTLSLDDSTAQQFFEFVAPPIDTTDSNSDGYYDDPAEYEMIDSEAGGAGTTGDFALTVTSHGTGILLATAWNAIPPADSDIQTWIQSFNYPFGAAANRISTDGITIPNGLFREFDICAPAGDEPDGDSSGLYYPVWISRIESLEVTNDTLRFYFATHNTLDSDPSTDGIEFATMDLVRTASPGDIVEIAPATDLKQENAAGYQQHFGRGHVVLSSVWDESTTIGDFFDAFSVLVESPRDTGYAQANTRISSFGVSRVPKYTPTVGQSQALVGTLSDMDVPTAPSSSNRYVVEGDCGVGDQLDLEAEDGIDPHAAISRYGYTGCLAPRTFKLIIDNTQVGDDELTFYSDEVLPRIVAILGRQPQFGDRWYSGVGFATYNGDAWVT